MAPDTLPSALESRGTTRELAHGGLLFRQGDPATAIFRLESGQLRLIRRTIDDHLVILHTARPGEFFAEAALFADSYHCDAVATVASRVRVYSKAQVKEALRADPVLAETFMARLARQLQQLRTRMELRNVRSAGDRVLQYLRLRAGADGRGVEMEGQLQDIAAEIGMTREALYRTLATLEAKGYLIRTQTKILLKKTSGA